MYNQLFTIVFVFVFFFLFNCQYGYGQIDTLKKVDPDFVINTDHSYLRINHENDWYKLRGKTDRYFSNGMRFEFQLPQGKTINWKIKKFFPTLPKKSYRKNKMTLIYGMNMYTPEDITLSEVDSTGRPYAGWMFFGLGSTSNSFSRSSRLTTAYTIGMIGPSAGQKFVQTKFHEITGDPIPQGWDNQIANDVALNINYMYEKRIFYPTDRLEAISVVEVNAGTVSNFVGFGGQVRLGRFNDFFYNSSGLKMREKEYDEEDLEIIPFVSNLNRDFQFYFTARATFRFALDNSLMEGGFITYKNSPFVLTSDDIQRFYMHAQFGMTLVIRKIGITFSQFYRSKEFIEGNPTHWGGIRLVIGLGG